MLYDLEIYDRYFVYDLKKDLDIYILDSSRFKLDYPVLEGFELIYVCNST